MTINQRQRVGGYVMSGILTSVHDGRIMIDDGCDSIDIAVSDWAELKATIDKKIKADDEKLSSDGDD